MKMNRIELKKNKGEFYLSVGLKVIVKSVRFEPIFIVHFHVVNKNYLTFIVLSDSEKRNLNSILKTENCMKSNIIWF